MDIRQLRYFSEIVNAKSFTRAADRVRVAQPALGLQIRKLEEELGVSLLHRHSRGVEPTEAGTVLLRHATAILKQVEQARREVTDLSGPPRGEITLGITPTASALLAKSLVERCWEKYPDISLNLFEGLSEGIMRRLGENKLDMGFTYNSIVVSGIRTEPLLLEDLYLIVPTSEEDPGGTIPFSEVCQRELILPSRGFGLRKWVEEAARGKDLELKIVLEIDAVATSRDLVESGLGCGILPYAGVQQSVAAGRLYAAQIVRPRIPRTLHFGYASSFLENKASRAVRSLIDEVIEERIAASDGRLKHA